MDNFQKVLNNIYNKAIMDKIYTFGDIENISSFITSLKRKANKLGIQLQLDNNKFIIDNKLECAGYFMEKIGRIPGILATATGLSIKEWLPILVHESCHMDQWNEKIKLWDEADRLNPNLIDEWLNGKDFSTKRVEAAINITRDLELDCEKRAVKKIKKFNLPIDISEYIQKGNCYLFFHNYMKKTRKWYDPKNDPFTNPKIYKLVSKDWYESYDETPKEIERLFKKYKI